MTRKISINGSEKIICRYFDNGYFCFVEKRKYFHSLKNCGAQNCKDLTCQDRHPQVCSFFQRQKCKFSENCPLKHEQKGEEHDFKVCNDKVSKSINLVKDLENIVESLKKELERKT